MTDPNDTRPDDTFDKFFRPRSTEPARTDDDATDPGVPSSAYAEQPTHQAPAAGAQYFQQPEQGSGYVEQQPQQHETGRKAGFLLPLMILLASLAVLSFVGYLFLRGGDDAGRSATTSPVAPTGGTTGTGSSSGPSSAQPSTSSTPSSPSSTPVALPAGSDTDCGDSTFSTSPNVTCAFAQNVAEQAAAIRKGSSQQVGVRSSTTGKQYVFDCNHPDGSFITCVGTSQPDDGRRPTVYVLPK